MNIKTKQVVSISLAVIGSAGTILTAYLARKAALNEENIIREHADMNELERPLDPKYTKKCILKSYIPTIVVGGATIASIISSTIISRKTEASLAAMAVLADQGLRKYKSQAKQILGMDKHNDILKGMAQKDYDNKKDRILSKLDKDARKLYYEEHVGFFLADPELLALAYSNLNQRLHTEENGVSSYFTMIYDFMKDCNAELLDKTINISSLNWGWSTDQLLDMYEFAWVHMFQKPSLTNDNIPYILLEWDEEPILDPSNLGEFILDIDDTKESTFISAIPETEKANEE